MKKLSSYLSAGIAATATFQSTDAATVVTFYGSGARSPFTSPATPVGILMGAYGGSGLSRAVDVKNSSSSFFALNTFTNAYFTSGNDLKANAYWTRAMYKNPAGMAYGAQLGSQNFTNISFNGNDSVYEAVGQFYFDGETGGYLVALARNSDGSALSISQGKAAIDAVPEPSAIALLSLGAGGLILRRRRKAA